VGISGSTRDDPSLLANASKPSVLLSTLINASKAGLSCLQMTQDATMMASGFADRVVRVWRMDQQHQRQQHSSSSSGGDEIGESGGGLMELKGHAAYGLSFSAEQRHLLSAGAEGGIRLWDLKSGQVGRQTGRRNVLRSFLKLPNTLS
jgi:WD40 repeat protein